MRRTVTLSLEVEDGEDVLLIAMLSATLSLSVARRATKEEFAPALRGAPVNDRPVSVVVSPAP